MSTLIHVLLKADRRLEDDVADDKADPSVGLKLNQISVLQYFFRNGWLHGLPTRCSFRSGCKQGRVSSGSGLLLPQVPKY